jgi:hypothetical protein
MIIGQSADALQGSLYEVWFTVVQFMPAIIAAVSVFIIGWVIGLVLCRVVSELAKALRFDAALKAAGVGDVLRRANLKLDAGEFLGTLVMWFVVLVFLVASLDILGLSRVTIFLQQVVLYYLPQVIVAALIVMIGAVVAGVVRNIVSTSAHATGLRSANFAGAVAKWSIWIIAILAALNQLGIASEFVQMLFAGFVIAMSLAFGLAFGLGGRDAAARAIDQVTSEISHRRD